MWRGADASSIDVPAMWAQEEALSVRDRRRRYRCGKNFKTIRDLHPWTYLMVEQFPDIHTTPVVPVEAKPDEAASASEPTPAPTDTPVPTEATPATTETSASEKPAESTAEEDAVEKLTEFANKLAIGEPTESSEDSDSDQIHLPSRLHPPTFAPNAILNRKVTIYRGDITSLEIDAIVNAANRSLLGGGGVDGAIHSAAGNQLYRECLTLNGANTGETKITRGYNLPAKYILHTVGPIGENPERLTSCYQTCLELCEKHNIRTVAFCGVSTGIYGYPREAASHVALNTARQWLEKNHEKVDRIIFVTFLSDEQRVYSELLPLYFPPCADKEYYDEYVEQLAKWTAEPGPTYVSSESSSDEDEYGGAGSSDSDSDDAATQQQPAPSPAVVPTIAIDSPAHVHPALAAEQESEKKPADAPAPDTPSLTH